jgi:L-alanine-DL-glutamate epimerase-like enolase superfamily enzyme
MLAEDILQQTVRVADGHVTVPQGAGLGVVLDEDRLRRFRVDL